jgi:hypothetical protein
MLSLIRHEQADEPLDYSEAVSRLATVRHALRLVDGGFGDGPSDDLDSGIASCWPDAGPARQSWFDRRSSRLVAQTAAGIEALLGARHGGQEPHREASRMLVDEIRRELRDVAGIITA